MILGINGIIAGKGADTDALAFITAASITDSTQKSAINQLVLDLKSANIWTKMKAIYPFVGGTASQHRFNLKDPRTVNEAFYLSFYGGGTHSANGYSPNGTTAYADTKLIPNSILTTSSAGFGVYLRTLNTSSATSPYFLGNYNSGTQQLLLGINVANTNMSFAIAGTTRFANTTPIGLFQVYKTTDVFLYKNNTLVSQQTSSGTLPTNSVFIGTIQLNNNTPYNISYVNSEYAMLYFCDALTASEATALYNAVNAFQVALSRNV